MIELEGQSYQRLCDEGLQQLIAEGQSDSRTVIIMAAAAIVCSQNKAVGEDAKLDGDSSMVSVSSAGDGNLDDPDNNNGKLDAGNQVSGSSQYTDCSDKDVDENDNDNVEVAETAKPDQPPDHHGQPSGEEILSDQDPRHVRNRVATPVPKRPLSSRSHSPRGSQRDEKRRDDSSSDETGKDSTRNFKHKRSSVEYKLGRKNLLKIERLTDSDSRSRRQMQKRALSPPSSSDDENLYIGWVAYPALPSRRHGATRRQRPLCTCIEVIKCVFYPVTKVCQICRSNKVGDVTSLPNSATKQMDQLSKANLYQ